MRVYNCVTQALGLWCVILGVRCGGGGCVVGVGVAAGVQTRSRRSREVASLQDAWNKQQSKVVAESIAPEVHPLDNAPAQAVALAVLKKLVRVCSPAGRYFGALTCMCCVSGRKLGPLDGFCVWGPKGLRDFAPVCIRMGESYVRVCGPAAGVRGGAEVRPHRSRLELVHQGPGSRPWVAGAWARRPFPFPLPAPYSPVRHCLSFRGAVPLQVCVVHLRPSSHCGRCRGCGPPMVPQISRVLGATTVAELVHLVLEVETLAYELQSRERQQAR
jgi:hypothetical protein